MGIVNDTSLTIVILISVVVLSLSGSELAINIASFPGGQAVATLLVNDLSTIVGYAEFALVVAGVTSLVGLLLWFINTISSSSHETF